MDRRQTDSQLAEIHDCLGKMRKEASERHTATMSAITELKTFRISDKEDLEKLEKQCGKHERAYNGGKWIVGLIGLVGGGTFWEWVKAHWPHLKS